MKRANRFVRMAVVCALAACHGESIPGEGDGDAPLDGNAGPAHTVTLLTGHRITVRGDLLLSVDPPAGRQVAFRTYRHEGHLYVVPLEAERLMTSGVLDRRLFDVTGLIELGYDDARRADLPLIVTYRPGTASSGAAESSLRAAGAQLEHPLVSIGGAAVRAPKRAATGLWSALAGGQRAKTAALDGEIARVWLDGMREIVLDQSVGQIGAPAAWAEGLTGQGVTVAVLDTGIALDHPDFAGRIVDTRSFVDGEPDASDGSGHGTHVASIVAGSGAAGGGQYQGVAPDAQLLVGKVCDQFGFCPDSSLIAGMEWAAQNGATVVNLSLGGPNTPEVDPLEQAIDELTAQHGTLFVAAAGNSDSCGGRVGSPSTADAALSVGAVDRDDQIAFFSCHGPRIGDGAIKPDIAAPGVDIVASRAAGTPLGDFDPVDDAYARLSGTSMATPHVAGAAAILSQLHPEWRAAELKSALMVSASGAQDQNAFAVGAGRVDVAAAIDATVFTAPISLNFGIAPAPHDDDEPIRRTVVYRNRGASQVAFQLRLDAKGPFGEPAADGMFTVDPAELTIPAGGEAPVTVTADTRAGGPDGRYSGVLIATAGDRTVRTPLSLDKEAETYELTVDVLDRDGAPVDDRFVDLIDVERGALLSIPAGSPARLRRTTYVVDATFFATDASGEGYGAMLVHPPFELVSDRSILMDGRLARPVAITVPAPASARRALDNVAYQVRTAFGSMTASLSVGDPFGTFGLIYTAQIGDPPPDPRFSSATASTWAEPGPAGEAPFAGSPYVFATAFTVPENGFPTGFTRHVAPAEFAVVEHEYAQTSPALRGQAGNHGIPIDFPFGLVGVNIGVDLPGKRKGYYLADGVEWSLSLGERTNDEFGGAVGSLTTSRILRAGTTIRDRWNQAPLGPSMDFPEPFAQRVGDVIELREPPLFSDQANHFGTSPEQAGTARLFRDGLLIGETEDPTFASFPVPPETGDYRLEMRSIRGGFLPGSPAALSTQLDLAWTFRSGADGPRALPLAAVKFAPRLDERNGAPAGQHFAIPATLSRPTGAPVARLRRLGVDVSYDAGETWQRALVVRLGDVALVLIRHPRQGGGTVSLRATAADKSGNTLEQTILDAYHLR
jgi:subtilisin family serine protease